MQLQRLGGAALQFLDHHLAAGGLHHHAVAAADRRARRHHDDVAVAVSGLHRIAGDLQRIGVLVVGRRQRHLVPALAGRKTAVVEIAAAAGLREAEQRHRLQAARAVADQLHEGVDRGIGRSQRLGDQFGRWPALAAVGGDALGFVEGGGVEAGAFGEPRGRQPGAFGQPVERGPDLAVGEDPRALDCLAIGNL